MAWADQGFQVLSGLLGRLGFSNQEHVLLLQLLDLLGVAADLQVVGDGQLFELVDGLPEGLEDLVELDHVASLRSLLLLNQAVADITLAGELVLFADRLDLMAELFEVSDAARQCGDPKVH